MFTRAGQPRSCIVALYVGRGPRGNSAWLSAGFQSLPMLPTSKLGPSGADSWLDEFVYVLGPCGLSNKLSCEAGSFSHHHSTHRSFQSEVLRLYFHTPDSWVAPYTLLPSCSSQLICMQMWTAWVLQPLPCLPWSASCPLALLVL